MRTTEYRINKKQLGKHGWRNSVPSIEKDYYPRQALIVNAAIITTARFFYYRRRNYSLF
jgi:hypothetical protein